MPKMQEVTKFNEILRTSLVIVGAVGCILGSYCMNRSALQQITSSKWMAIRQSAPEIDYILRVGVPTGLEIKTEAEKIGNAVKESYSAKIDVIDPKLTSLRTKLQNHHATTTGRPLIPANCSQDDIITILKDPNLRVQVSAQQELGTEIIRDMVRLQKVVNERQQVIANIKI